MSAISAAILAGAFLVLGCLALLFVWHPIQRFLLLREEVTARVALFKRERARYQKTRYLHAEPSRSLLLRTKERHLVASLSDFNELAFKMKSFAETQRIATWALQKLNLDPLKAEAGLHDLADSIACERDELYREQEPLASPRRQRHG